MKSGLFCKPNQSRNQGPTVRAPAFAKDPSAASLIRTSPCTSNSSTSPMQQPNYFAFSMQLHGFCACISPQGPSPKLSSSSTCCSMGNRLPRKPALQGPMRNQPTPACCTPAMTLQSSKWFLSRAPLFAYGQACITNVTPCTAAR